MSDTAFIPIDEHAELLELGHNTQFDYLFHENAPFCAISGRLLHDYGIYDVLKQQSGEYCVINYIHLFGINIRFPDIALMCFCGIIIGLRGFIQFTKYNRMKLSLSFLFYAGMNITGCVCHSLLAITSKYRVLFALFEKACTGTSGLFLSVALYELLHNKINTTSNVDILYLIVIAFVIALLCIVEIVAVFVYIFGCTFVFMASFHILQYQRQFKNVDVNLIKIGNYAVVILVLTIICFCTSSVLCNATMGIYNGASAFFAITHIGLMIVHHFLNIFLQKHKHIHSKSN